MRTSWLNARIVMLVIAGGLSVGVLSAAEDKTIRVIRPAAPAEGEIAILDVPQDDAEAVAADDGCVQFGEPFEPLTSSDAYRGNTYRFTSDATVLEIRMELQFQGSVTLTWMIHEGPSEDVNVEYTRIFARAKVENGDGTRTVYSSGPLCNPATPSACPQLPFGKDYLIGVSWIGTPTVVARRGALRDSRVVGAVATTAPVTDPLGPETPFNREQYLQVCFTPFPGACCDASAGQCLEVLEEDCVSSGSFFAGELSTCTPVLCEFGACCRPNGDCDTDYSSLGCADEGGTWQGPGVICPTIDTDLCPVILGACCHGNQFDSVCVEESIDECDVLDGVYQGDGTTCDINPCTGACCISDFGCFDLAESSCALQNGSFKGPGSTCDDLDPADQCGGACCQTFAGQPRCILVGNRDQCSDKPPFIEDSTYMGDETTCANGGEICDTLPSCVDGACVSDSCDGGPNNGGDCDVDSDCDCPPTVPSGACCLQNGTCDITDQTSCEGINSERAGSFKANVDCSAVSCTTCCLPDGTCQQASDAVTCIGTLSGTVEPLGSTTCVPSLCGEPTGACCLTDPTGVTGGLCEPTAEIEADCDAAGGRFEVGEACGICPTLDLGACCRPNETCTDRTTSGECDTAGGDFSPSEDCLSLTTPCPQRSSCCDPNDGFCYFVLESQCDAIGGDFRLGQDGGPTVCDATICAAACCSRTGGCSVLSGEFCESQDRWYTDLDTECAPDPCPTGACCFADKDCEMLLEAACNEEGGTYNGNGIACQDSQECTGACCAVDGSCAPSSAAACVGNFRGVDTKCEADTCTGACCTREGFCEIASATNCESLAGDYKGVDTFCDPQTCPTGACCLGTGCEKLIEDSCVDEGGTYTSDDIECVDSECPGACCALDGTCSEISSTDCATLLGVFNGIDSKCDANTCDGACCDRDGACSPTTELVCDAAGNWFQGVVTACDVDACVTGACCLPGGCEMLLEAACLADGGVYDGDGVACLVSSCDGACCDDNGCDIRPADGCLGSSEIYRGNGTLCETNTCDGGCCIRDGSCLDTSPTDCDTQGGTFNGVDSVCDAAMCSAGACCLDTGCEAIMESACDAELGTYQGDDVSCFSSTCNGVCCNGSECSILSEIDCEIVPPQGRYVGNGTTCAISFCSSLIGGDPPDGGVEARQPTEPNGTNPADSVLISFDVPVSGLQPNFFAVEQSDPTEPNPTVIQVDPGPTPDTAVLTLSDRLVPLAWTKIEYILNSSQTCFGFLPGDVDQSFTSDVSDILAIQDCLTNEYTACVGGTTSGDHCDVDSECPDDGVDIGTCTPGGPCTSGVCCVGGTNHEGDCDPNVDCGVDAVCGVTTCSLSQCDMDRSGECTSADLLRLLDLLGGGGAYDVGLDETIDPSCPFP